MSTHIERMKTALFPSEGKATENVKFFLGHGRSVSAEQLADQLDRANAQIRNNPDIRTRVLDGHLSVKPL